MVFQRVFQDKSNRTAIITPQDGSFTYGDLERYQNELFAIIGRRTLVFCLCTNAIGSLIGYVAFLNNRIVPLMLDAGIDRELLASLIEKYQPEYLWVPSPQIKSFIGSIEVFSIFNYSLLELPKSAQLGFHNDLALLLTTSGSTGSPKLVRVSYANLIANAESIAEYLCIDENEKPISILPMSYSYGISIINSHLLKGATILLTNQSLMEKGFWTFLREQRASSFAGVPYTYEMLKKIRFFNFDLPYLTTFTQAGGKLNDLIKKDFAEHFVRTNKKFFIMYGQTEATARMSYLPHELILEKVGSIGIPIPGGEFSIVDEHGDVIDTYGVVGELLFRGKNVCLGYAFNLEDLSKGDENHGVLLTGDLALRDADGYYYLVGRKSRYVKIFGNRISLDEVEGILKDIVKECACTGDDDKIIIYIEGARKIELIKQYISGKLGIHHSAFVVKLIECIPKNNAGKILYSKLKD